MAEIPVIKNKVVLSRQQIVKGIHYAKGEQEVTPDVEKILQKRKVLVELPPEVEQTTVVETPVEASGPVEAVQAAVIDPPRIETPSAATEGTAEGVLPTVAKANVEGTIPGTPDAEASKTGEAVPVDERTADVTIVDRNDQALLSGNAAPDASNPAVRGRGK